MTEKREIWNTIGSTLTALSPYYQERMIRLVQEYDAPNTWFSLNWVRASEPDAFNLEENISLIDPYSNRQHMLDTFESFVETGFLEKEKDVRFRLTDRGRSFIEGFFNNAHEGLAEAEPLPTGELDEAEDLLHRLVMAVQDAPLPEDKPWFTSSRWTDPGEDAPATVRIDQFVTDLSRFRDDAHMAAWRSYGVNGLLWETLTVLWRDEAGSAAELAEQLSFRGYDEGDYSSALKELEQKGWVEESDTGYRITDEGRRIRQEAEEETDRLFFAAWSALSDEELERLYGLLSKANETLELAGRQITWQAARDVVRNFFPLTRAAVNPLFEEYFESPRHFFPTFLASGSEPEPFSLEAFSGRNPYTNPQQLGQTLSEISESGLLQDGQGQYRVSEQGHKALDKVNDVFYGRLGELDVLSEEEVAQVEAFMRRLVEASLDAPEPAEKPITLNMHRCHRHTNYPSMALIDMHMDDLGSFRDEAHIAAWRPYGVDGRTWETLSYVWREEAQTAPKLVETLGEGRGYEEGDYATSLEVLTEHGWTRPGSGGYETTAEGAALRQKAESETDRLFFEPWRVLDERELRQFRYLLLRMKIELEKLAEQLEASSNSEGSAES